MQVTITTQGGEQIERAQLEEDLRHLADKRGWSISVTHREQPVDTPPASLSRRGGVAAVTDRGPCDP